MSSSLYRLGQRCAHHPWRIVGVGLLIAAIVLGILSQLGAATVTDPANVRTTESTVEQVRRGSDVTVASNPIGARAEEDRTEFGGWLVPIDIGGNKGVGLPVAVLVLLVAFVSLADDHRNLPGPDH